MVVKWTKEALKQVKAIKKELIKLNSKAGSQLIEQIIEAAENIKKSPQKGSIVPEFKVKQIREIKFNNVSIIYFIKTNSIEIISLFKESEVLNRDRLLKNKFN